jgi:uncharacterized membrane protein YoaK (UPF0700 family)
VQLVTKQKNRLKKLGQGTRRTRLLLKGRRATLFAMAVQNTMMRLILNNLPPTTIMTGNITHMVTEGVRLTGGFGGVVTPSEASMLTRRAQRIGLALASFTAGAIIGGLAQRHVGYLGLLVPIAALLILIPIGRNEMRAVARF